MALSFLTDHTSPRMRTLSERIVRSWNERCPDVPVSLAVLDHEEFRDRLEHLLTDEPTPDVMTWFAGNRTRSLVDRGLMRDIRELWRSADIATAYHPRFAPGPGAAYFLPTSHYWWAVYYQPAVLRSAGVRTPIRTWDELRAAAAALRAAGIVPFALGARYRCPAAAWFDYLNLRLNGPGFHRDLTALRVPYTDDRVREVFRFWQRLLDDGWFHGEPWAYDEEQAVAAVQRGEAGMTLIGSYVSDEYVPEGDPELDFFRFPVIDPALPVGEDAPVDGYFVAGGSRRPEQAVRFLGHLGSREVQQRTVELLNVLPTRHDVALDRGSRHVPKGMRLLDDADHLAQFYDLDTPWELADAGMDAFVSFLREPSAAAALLREVETLRLELAGGRSG